MQSIKRKTTKAFEPMWWDSFLEKTHNLTRTATFKSCIRSDEIVLMQKYLLHMVSMLSKMRTNELGYRVYLNGKLLSYKEMEEIYDHPPNEHETFESWAKRCFKDKKFGMIINRGERFNPDLAALISNKIAPLLEKKGVPCLGMTFTTFIGNYGWTPLGIHQDERGESVIHFHLGKGDKTMYTWDKKIYEDMTKPVERMNNPNIEDFLPYANEYPFGEGDIYFMPQGEYHVGHSNELSMGLTLWFNNHIKTKLSQRPIKAILDQYFEENDDITVMDKNKVENLSNFEKSLELFNLPIEFEKLTLKQLLKETYKEFRYALYSNGGFCLSPFPREEEFNFNAQTIIQLALPYRILYHENLDRNKIYIYTRGKKIVLDNHECIKALIDKVNEGNTVTARSLWALLKPDWDEDIRIYVLNLLYLNHAINIMN